MMPKWLIAALCCAGLALGADRGAQKILPYAYTQEDLPNGLKLVTVPTDFPNIVAVYIVVRAGARNEVEPGHTGFAHLFEHLMFKGTPDYPAGKYTETLRDIGASSNAFTTEDYTCYYTVFSKEDLPTVLMMEADRFQHLKYSEPEFKTETLAVLGEYNKNSSSPSEKLNETLYDTAYTTGTYKHTAMGFLKDIEAMPGEYEYSLQYFSRYYRPEYTTILVVGDVRQRTTRQLVDKFWGNWKRGDYKADIPKEPAQEEARQASVDFPGPSLPMVDIGYKGPAFTDSAPDTAALAALAALAFSDASPLYQKLVIEEQKAASLFASAPDRVDPGLFEVGARVRKPEDVEYVQNQILETIAALRDHPVDAERLDKVKKHLRYEASLDMDASDAVAAMLAQYIAVTGTPDAMNKLYERYASLTPEDIQKAAATYLVEKNRTTVTLKSVAGGSQ
ncbi:MAG TPA: pitrilysin family protein [Candidatus Limnocylindrales bacterium]|nr:pitrilysin family protein [Candidatus Limnocylindrales bacterium]